MGNIVGKSSKIRLVEDDSLRKLECDEKRTWLECAAFCDLPAEGREALLKFCRDQGYETDASRLEFYFSSPEDSFLEPLFMKYLVDGEKQLPEVQENDDVDGILEHAKEVDSYVKELKNRMRPRLNDMFKKFKSSVAEEIKDLQKFKS